MIPRNDIADLVWAQSWQLAVLIAATLLAVRWWGRRRAHLAYVLWLVVLIKCLTPPLWSAPTGIFCWLRDAEAGPQVAPAVRDVDTSVETIPIRNDAPSVIVNISTDVVAPPSSMTYETPVLPRPAESKVVVETTKSHSVDVRSGLLIGWCCGIALIIGVSLLRWRLFLFRLRKAPRCHSAQLNVLLSRLARKLRIRQRVRLMITNSRIGPAVIGLFRPTILLPEMIVRGKSAEDLAPILAHELLHVRRGDLWCGLLQLGARALWWFHPLVWLATRAAAREAERCCDEEVLAELKCDPARYARSLLDVLEQKVRLQAVPTFPGVRAIDVTSQRLERIMKIGNGCRRRTPWWCWLVLLLVSIMALPGESLGWGKNKKKRKQPKDAPSAAADANQADSLVLPAPIHSIDDVQYFPPAPALPWAPSEADEQVTSVTHDVRRLLHDFQQQFQADPKAAQGKLEEILISYVGRQPNEPAMQCTWSGTKITVRHSAAAQVRVAEAVAYLLEHGIHQMQTEAIVISGPAADIGALPIVWNAITANMQSEIEQIDLRDDDEGLLAASAFDRHANQGLLSQTQERQLPLRIALLDDEQARALENGLEEPLRVLARPKVISVGGESLRIHVGAEHPVGTVHRNEATGESKARVGKFWSGWSMQLCCLPLEGNETRLTCELELTDVGPVTSVKLPSGGDGETTTFEYPSLSKFRVELAHLVPAGKTLVVGGLTRRLENVDELQTVIVLLRTNKLTKTASAAAVAPPAVYAQPQARPTVPVPVPLPARATTSSPRTAATPTAGPIATPTAAPTATPTVDRTGVVVALDEFDRNTQRLSQLASAAVHTEGAELQLAALEWTLTGQGPDGSDEWRIRAASGTAKSSTSANGKPVLEIRLRKVQIVAKDFDAEADTAELNLPTVTLLGSVRFRHRSGVVAHVERLQLKTIEGKVELLPADRAQTTPSSGDGAAARPMETKQYAVADLVVPLPFEIDQGAVNSDIPATTGKNTNANLQQLSQLIQQRIAPDSWSAAGGSGQMETNLGTLSIAIEQSPAVHQQIDAWFAGLRRSLDRQCVCEVKLLRIDNRQFFEQLGADFDFTTAGKIRQARLSDQQATSLMEAAQQLVECNLQQLPRITLMHGQRGKMNLQMPGDAEGSLELTLTPHISGDRHQLGMHLRHSNGPTLDLDLDQQTTSVGPTWLLVDASDISPEDDCVLMLVTSRIVTPEAQ